MKDLCDDELLESIKSNLIWALNRSKDSTDIIFMFYGKNGKLISKQVIEVFGDITFKDVCLETLTKKQAVDLIVNNFYYDYFTFISREVIEGEVECHGHGEYWSENKIIITYKRLSHEC